MKKFIFVIALVSFASGFAGALQVICSDDPGTTVYVTDTSGQGDFSQANVRVKSQQYYSAYEGFTTPTAGIQTSFSYTSNPSGNDYYHADFDDGLNIRNWSVTIDVNCLHDSTQPQPSSGIWDNGSNCTYSATCY